MIETLIGSAEKIFSVVLRPAYSYAKKHLFRPSVETSKAPKNIFDHIQPSASKDRVKEVLGSPHRMVGDAWGYRFKDAMVQIEFWDSGSAKSVALALTIYSSKAGFRLPMIDQPLGVLTLEDAMNDQGDLEYRSSLRTEEVLWKTRIGATGAWLNYTFGSLLPLAPGYLAETSFQWDHESKQLITSPADVKINWIAISDSMEEVWFDWSLGIPAID
jgi:hypothetical protein